MKNNIILDKEDLFMFYIGNDKYMNNINTTEINSSNGIQSIGFTFDQISFTSILIINHKFNNNSKPDALYYRFKCI